MYKVAFVSGASRGIGRAIATSLAKEGYHLGLVCRKNQKMLEDLAEDLRSVYHIEVLTFTGDVGDPSFVKALAEEMLAHFSQIDVLVNNAGISHIGLLTDMSVEEWDQILSVNLSSCFYTAKAFVPTMVQKQSGRIINISSMWGNVGASCEIAYSASKGGIHAFTKALAKELAPSRIAVNAIACGVIDTDMNGFLSVEERTALEAEIPAGRFAQPEEVAEAVLQVIKMPTYLTGQVISMDGGYI